MVESYISIDLNDPRAKNISEVIGNATCKKILNLLSEKELTETEISKELNMPLNSVGYNIKKLVQAELIESTKHWWSSKGKKMPPYKLSNKKIIISPRNFSSKTLLVTTLLIGTIASIFVRFLTKTPEILLSSQDNIEFSLKAAAAPIAESALSESPNVISFFSSIASWEWFLIGAWFATLLFFILTKFSKNKK